MYRVSVNYEYEYEAYGRKQMMQCEDLIIVVASTQYSSMDKTLGFIRAEHDNAAFNEIRSEEIDESGRCEYFINVILV